MEMPRILIWLAAALAAAGLIAGCGGGSLTTGGQANPATTTVSLGPPRTTPVATANTANAVSISRVDTPLRNELITSDSRA
jgi:hypothetical protein